MTRTSTLLTLGLSLLLSPMGALAYVDPYEALNDEIFFLPPSARHAQARVDAQNALYAARRAAANSSSEATSSSRASEPTRPAAPPAPVTDPRLVDAIHDLSNAVADLQDRVNDDNDADARALARIRMLRHGAAPQQPQPVLASVPQNPLAAEGTLRPGAPRAPLPRSGPAATILGVLALAAVGTVAWAQRKRESL